jgi:hypothetical protein
LTRSLRDIGYDFTDAVADLVDNSISAGAARVDIDVVFDGVDSYVLVADDGAGMTAAVLAEAMRFGTRREYAAGDLGRFGLGLKTASISQARRLTVVTRRAKLNRRFYGACLDLDLVERSDSWRLAEPARRVRSLCEEWLSAGPGTVIVWEHLDRVLPASGPEGGWAKRRLEALSRRTAEHLGMVFHRYLEGTAARSVVITVNGEKVRPWNPFAPDEPDTVPLPPQSYEIASGGVVGKVTVEPVVLPAREQFSSHDEFERLSGPNKWNRQQGIYVYRADRMIQSGGWCGMRAVDEHTKFARIALYFDTQLDEVLRINVAKMRVLLPTEMRRLLERPVHEVCQRANARYRRAVASERTDGPPPEARGAGPTATGAKELAAILMALAIESGEFDSLGRLFGLVRERHPGLAGDLGL